MESKDQSESEGTRIHPDAPVQRSAPAVEPARGYWLLTLGSAALLALYLGTYLFVFGNRTPVEASEQGEGYLMTWVMLAPVLAFNSLVSGARERFSIRTRSGPLHWVLVGLCLAGFAVLGALSVVDIAYPWWLNVLLPLALFAVMAAAPIRGLLATPRGPVADWRAAPLSSPARLVTGIIGLVIGVLIATSAVPSAAMIAGLIAMVPLVIVMLLSWESSYGLPRVGYEWGPIHWGAFCIGAVVVFASVVLTTFTSWYGLSWSSSAGVLVVLVMGAAAMLPRRGGRRGE
ncbi:MAG: hypothetical protein ACTHZX_03600 [Microbacterium sp.]